MYPSNSQISGMDGEKRRSQNNHNHDDYDREAERRRHHEYYRDEREDRHDRRHRSRHEDRNRSRSRSKERRHRRRSRSSDSDDYYQKEERITSSGRNPSPPRTNNDVAPASRFTNYCYQGPSQTEYAPSQTSANRSHQERASNSANSASASGITIKLAPPAAPKPSLPVASTPTPLVQKSSKVAAIFNDDDDDEPEEMPPECKMRMKNIGRDTPTSAGPNSFGKTKLGFCNSAHLGDPKLESPVGRGGPTKLPKWK